MDVDRALILGEYIASRDLIILFIWELKGCCNYRILPSCRYVYILKVIVHMLVFFNH